MFSVCQEYTEDIHLWAAFSYCSFLAVAFVASLYLIVPIRIRSCLPRDDPRHIQWRSFATAIVAALAWISYPYLFCRHTPSLQALWASPVTIHGGLLLHLHDMLSRSANIVLHTGLLYLGPIVQYLCLIRIRSRRLQSSSFLSTLYDAAIRQAVYYPLFQAGRQPRWILLRNWLIAPLTEELVFRGCMVPVVFAATGGRLALTCWLAPCFFGIAHLHHGYIRWRWEGSKLWTVLVVVVVQFIYTTLFGAYVSYAVLVQQHAMGEQQQLRILPVVLCHAWCNAWGLPDVVSYWKQGSSLYTLRYLLLTVLLVGIMGFCITGWFWEWLP